MAADRGGTAIYTLEYQRRPEVASLPVRLAPRPVFLAGREPLLAELDAWLASGPGQSGPRLVALYGIEGAGKTSVAVDYAHRHLAEAGCVGSSRQDEEKPWCGIVANATYRPEPAATLTGVPARPQLRTPS